MFARRACGYHGDGELMVHSRSSDVARGKGQASMNEKQLEFPVVPGPKRAKKIEEEDLDVETRIQGRCFCPECGHDAAHAIVSNYQLCDKCDFDYGMTARAYFAQNRKVSSG